MKTLVMHPLPHRNRQYLNIPVGTVRLVCDGADPGTTYAYVYDPAVAETIVHSLNRAVQGPDEHPFRIEAIDPEIHGENYDACVLDRSFSLLMLGDQHVGMSWYDPAVTYCLYDVPIVEPLNV